MQVFFRVGIPSTVQNVIIGMHNKNQLKYSFINHKKRWGSKWGCNACLATSRKRFAYALLH